MSGYFQNGQTLSGGPAGSGLNILVPAAGALLGGALVGGTITPATITVGSGLSLTGDVLSSTGSGGTVTQVATTGAGISGGPITTSGTLAVEWNAGTVAAIGNGLTIAANTMSISAGSGLAFSLGALVAQWQGGTVTSLGSGVSLAGGVLSATGSGGSVTSVTTTGAGIAASPATIVAAGTLSVEWNAGTVASIGNGLTLVTNTLSLNAGSGLAFSTGALTFATRTASTIMGNPAATPAAPTDIAIGSGLSLSTAGTLTAVGSNPFPIAPTGAVQSVGSISVTGANTGMAIITTGTGALMMNLPDNTATGGNARGSEAIDLQSIRSTATQVASGANAIIVGNSANVASGQNAIAIGGSNTVTALDAIAVGQGNTSSGANASVAIGFAATATNNQSVAIGVSSNATGVAAVAFQGCTASGNTAFAAGSNVTNSGSFAAAFATNSILSGSHTFATGDQVADRGNTGGFYQGKPSGFPTQHEQYVLQVATTGATAVRLTADGTAAGATNVCALGNNSTVLFEVRVICFDVTSGASLVFYTANPGMLHRGANAASTTLGTGAPTMTAGPTTTTPPTLGANPSITADTTNGALNISVTPPAANTDTWHFTAVVRQIYVS